MTNKLLMPHILDFYRNRTKPAILPRRKNPVMMVEIVVSEILAGPAELFVCLAQIPSIAIDHADSAPFYLRSTQLPEWDSTTLRGNEDEINAGRLRVTLIGWVDKVDRRLLTRYSQKDFDDLDLRNPMIFPRLNGSPSAGRQRVAMRRHTSLDEVERAVGSAERSLLEVERVTDVSTPG